MKKQTILWTVLGAIVFAGSAAAQEVAWPTAPITVILSANPGGGLDLTGRITGKYLGKLLGQPLANVNVAGAGGSLGARQVKDAKPDGYTIAYHNDGFLASGVTGLADFYYSDFKTAGISAVCSNVTFVTTSRFKTFDEFVAYAKANPNKLKYGIQTGTFQEQMAAALCRDLDIKIRLIDVGSLNDIIVAMLGGHVDMACGPMGLLKDYIASGDFTPHAVLAKERHPDYPNLPTTPELGVNYLNTRFFTYFFPKDTPDAIVNKFAAALKEVTQDPAFAADLKMQDFDAHYMDRDEAYKFMTEMNDLYIKYQKELNEFKKQSR